MLSKNCEYEIQEIIKEAALDYQQDPILAKACHEEVSFILLSSHCLFFSFTIYFTSWVTE